MQSDALNESYDPEFYGDIEDAAVRAARTIVPFLLDLLRPTSVVDVGCGTARWLGEMRDRGVQDVLGADGEWVPSDKLAIPPSCFRAVDLKRPLTAIDVIGRRFDLVISLEVAEHLPPERADEFVEALTRLGLVVLFSAAIPMQGGRDHVNEQWPSYWSTRFHTRGFEAVDCIRPRVWDEPGVESWYWYAQNTILYVHQSLLTTIERAPRWPSPPISVVHPQLLRQTANRAMPHNLPLRRLLNALPRAAWRKMWGRVTRPLADWHLGGGPVLP